MANSKVKSPLDKYRSSKKAVASSPKTLPNNLEAEQAVLCSVMLDPLAAENVMALLDVKDFYSETHKIIFDAMKNLYNANKPVDFVSVVDLLEKREQLEQVGGLNYITTLTNAVPSSAYHNHYAQIVHRDGVLRELIETCAKIEAAAYESESTDLLSDAEKALFEIGERGTTSGLEKMTDAFNSAMSTFDEINHDGGMKHGVRSGFIALDKRTGGFQKSDLIIIAARPGIGKTSLAMNIVSNAALEDGAKCAIFSLEMSKEQLAQRMLCSVAGVDMGKARSANLTDQDWTKLWKAHQKLEKAPIYCNENVLAKPSQIIAQCRKLKRERGLDLIVVDYLQLMKGDVAGLDRQIEVADMSRQMKVLAKEINVPVIVLSQMSRDVQKRTNHKPQLSDLRESGAIEQDADMVIFIDRQNPEDETEQSKSFIANLIIAKFRNGEPGTVNVGWDGNRVSFVNLSNDENARSLERTYEANHPNKQDEIEEVDAFEGIPESELEPPEFGDEDDIPAEFNFPPTDDILN